MTRAPSECVWVCVWGLAQVFGHAWHRATWLYFGILFFFPQCFSHSHILHTLKNELIFTYSWAYPNTPRESILPQQHAYRRRKQQRCHYKQLFFLAFPSQSELLLLSFLVVLLAQSIPSVNEWSSMSLSYAHTHTKQTPHLTGVKVHALYDEEPGSLWVIIPASLCSHWSIFIPHPEHTHTHTVVCHATPL